MDLIKLQTYFKENLWIINPCYKILMLIVYAGGPLTALFLLLLTYTTPGSTIWTWFIIFFSLLVGFKLGPSPFFIVNCSWIYFRFDKLGLWLPIVAYLIGLTIWGLETAADKFLSPGEAPGETASEK